MIDDLYPLGPATVQRELTEASVSYKRRAWIAMAVLSAFALLYLGFVSWFGFTAYRLTSEMLHGRFDLGLLLVAALSAFLVLFLSRALFAIKRSQVSRDVEVTAAQEPLLFAFLHRLADEAGAPRPHRVFLSGEVNAAVFYDVSFKNLLFPSRKNLLIGLGLVNALTLGEFKAVLAHEFGHFAQRSMAVGRWVYTAQQIASHLVHSRGGFDKFLRGLSRTDVRIAWVGWLMRMVVWAIRSILDTGFALVVLAERGLSREMELQADLVAVSLSGSDALVHALHRLRAADQAWDAALSFACSEVAAGRAVTDLFALQSRVTEQLRAVLDDESFGQPPPLPAQAAGHRVFKSSAHPPKMWLTHPPGREREDNAKRRYVPVPLDDRAAWLLFQTPASTRESMTTHLLSQVASEQPPAACQITETLGRLDSEFEKQRSDRRYRGAYLARSFLRDMPDWSALYAKEPEPSSLSESLSRLYPESLAAELKSWRELEEELGTLKALHEGELSAPDGIIRQRGRVLAKRELPAAIAELERETERAREVLRAHDALCRSTHAAAARALGQGWDGYLRGLCALLHYAEHSEANLRDARGHLQNVFAWVTADGNVSGRELKRLIKAASEVHVALWELFEQRGHVFLPSQVCIALEVESWRAALPLQLNLPAPEQQNIGEFLNHVGEWLGACIGPVSALKRAALDALLEAEEHVARCLLEARDPGTAPAAAQVPSRYTVLTRGAERAREKQLHWWDRFQLGNGLVASGARLLVAGAIMTAVLGVSQRAGDVTIHVHNGLDAAVDVRLLDHHLHLEPLAHARLELPLEGTHRIEARSARGELVEAFEIETSHDAGHYFYNVASASPLVLWTLAGRGEAKDSPERYMSNPRWGRTDADDIFVMPSGRSRHTRDVLTALVELDPEDALERVSTDAERARMIDAHLRWDRESSGRLHRWYALAGLSPQGRVLVEQRLERQPKDMLALRALQDLSEGAAYEALCSEQRKRADAAPEDADLRYLAIRCMASGSERSQAFTEAYSAHPTNPWLAWAVGLELAEQARWDESYAALRVGYQGLPALQDERAPELARVARRLGSTRELGQLEQHSRVLHHVFMVERGDSELSEPLQLGYVQLARGQLELAAAKAKTAQEGADRLLRLVAASRGASEAMVRDALALPLDRGLDAASVFSALALAARHGRELDGYRPLLARAAGEHANTLLEIAQPLALDSPTRALSAVEEALDGLPAVLRGQALVMASIVHAYQVPAKWIDEANALLFATERPYLGNAQGATSDGR